MLFSSIVIAAAAVAVNAQVQSTSASYVQASVPTGVPVAGDYSGALRPQIHFSPPQHFMNDPNGMFMDAEGTYHLYYQCKSASWSLSR